MNFGDAINASSMKHWSLTGPRRLVKVYSPSSRNFMQSPTDPKANHTQDHVGGYVTEERYLWGLNSTEIEAKLGLRPFELRTLAYIYTLKRLPKPDEVEFKYSAGFPDGKPVGTGKDQDVFHDKLTQARQDFADGINTHGGDARSMTPVVQNYGPGSFRIPQWKLTAPVPVGPLIAQVNPIMAFQRPNGSIKPYTPHNRGGV